MGEIETIQATERSIDILRWIGETEGLTATELVERSDLSRHSVYAHLKTLADAGLVIKEGGTYKLGLATLTLGGQARRRYRTELEDPAELQDLAAEVESLVQLAFLESDRCVYIYQTGQEYSALEHPRLGSQVRPHSSAVGKAILSQRPPEEREAFLDSDLPSETSATTTDRGALLAELERVAESLIAIEYGEQYPDVWCVATPVTFGAGKTGALSVSLPAETVEREWFENDLANTVQKTGRIVEMDAEYAELR